jgi:predicted DNA-binding protein
MRGDNLRGFAPTSTRELNVFTGHRKEVEVFCFAFSIPAVNHHNFTNLSERPMASAKLTVCMNDETFRRLKQFSRNSGLSQSTLVEQMVSRGLTHLEKNWLPANAVLDRAFATMKTPASSRVSNSGSSVKRGKRS